MGWLFSTRWDSKLALVAYLRGTERWTSDFKILKSTVRGSRHWYVAERVDGVRFIGLDLMQASRGDGWGFKDMDESCGPCYYDCPLSYLELAPLSETCSSFAPQWREKVRAHHAKEKARAIWSAGTVVVYGGHAYRLDVEAGARRGWMVTREKDGRHFRMTTRQLAAASLVPMVENSSMATA